MALKKIYLDNFTVFDRMEIVFSDGINVFIGENGSGKTHVMKLLYAACQAAQAKNTAVDFPQKVVKVFRPDDFHIGRLVSRKMGNEKSEIRIVSDANTLKMSFERRTKRWEAVVSGMTEWEKQYEKLTSTFIPAKEILSNSRNLVQAIDKGNIDFDDTYKDIISAASLDIGSGRDNERKRKYLRILQGIMNGKVKYENEEFYLMSSNQSKLEFQLVAEGMRKIALLWQLIKNGALENGTILFWDEPEANINPKHIPALVDILLSLQADGVQLFIATHDYVLAKYIEIKTKEERNTCFHSFYKIDDSIKLESNSKFKDLENNSITESYNTLLDEVFDQTIRG